MNPDPEDPKERQQLNDVMNAILLIINGASFSGYSKIAIQAALSIMLCQFYLAIKVDSVGKEHLLKLVGIDYDNIQRSNAEKEKHVSEAN